ncbi:hypothetical protein [uncultured Leifsonia sp.]|uniref:hypothetical protein n=1 Tax=uncultured Leifsonia sp. TaxID=340359 RepID=UPI0028D787B8|nr:hypothetical protein [uncultured Leifsonia sp.]
MAELGKPPLPIHRYMADVALEVDENGLFVYTTILGTLQRQVGKTTFDLAGNIQNALLGPNRRTWYTAQSGQHATDKFLEMADTWEGSNIKQLARKPRRSNGSASLTFINDSTFRPFPPGEGTLDGKQSDRTTLDEMWFWTIAQYQLMRQSYKPTQTTRRAVTGQRPQTWLWSTEGTVDSTALNQLLDEARSSTPSPTTAFFDWGIDDDDDPTDLDLIYAKHPGAGYLFDMDDLRGFQDEFRDAPDEFARAYGNRRTGATERVIPAGKWKDARWDGHTEPDPAGPVCFGVGVGVDGVDTTITANQLYAAGTLSAVVKGGWMEGTYGALERMRELADKYPDAAFAIDPHGPSAALHDAAERAGFRLVPLTATDVIAATQSAFAGLTNPSGATFRYKPHDRFDSAAELATKRYVGDGTWIFGRRASVGSISALESATLGAYGVHHMPAVRGMQLG